MMNKSENRKKVYCLQLIYVYKHVVWTIYMVKKSHTLMHSYTTVTEYKSVLSFSIFLFVHVLVLFIQNLWTFSLLTCNLIVF